MLGNAGEKFWIRSIPGRLVVKYLLFKRFVGVAASRLDSEFSMEQFTSIPNIFSKDVMIEDIPSMAPFPIGGTIADGSLDASLNWIDSSYNYDTNTFVLLIIFKYNLKI